MRKEIIFIGIIILSLMIAYGIVHNQYINKINAKGTTNNLKIATIPQTSQTTKTTTSQNKPVYLEIDPGTPTSCGTFCRETTSTITNIGSSTANNVYISLSISNDKGENVYSTQEFLGAISGGQSKSKTVNINIDCGAFYSKCIGHTPFTIKTEAVWDGGNQIFPVQQISG